MNTLSYLQRFGDIELAVRSNGRGTPFVWGHSLLGSMQVEDRAGLWDFTALESHAMVVRYDARGHGNSDGSYKREDYRWPHMASDMLAVARAFAAASGRQVTSRDPDGGSRASTVSRASHHGLSSCIFRRNIYISRCDRHSCFIGNLDIRNV